MASSRSQLLAKLEYFWNHYWSTNPRMILIVCGSSASWLIKNIIHQPGGLHNRTTAIMKIKPFTLSETKQYLHHHKVSLNQREIMKLYLALGGIPFYLTLVPKGQSASQAIQTLFLKEASPLKEEFTKLFASLFNDHHRYIDLVRLLAKGSA